MDFVGSTNGDGGVLQQLTRISAKHLQNPYRFISSTNGISWEFGRTNGDGGILQQLTRISAKRLQNSSVPICYSFTLCKNLPHTITSNIDNLPNKNYAIENISEAI